MMAFTNFTGLAGIVLFIAVVGMTVFRAAHLPKRWVALLTLGVVIAVCIPCGTLPPAAYPRGIMGDLSVTTVIWLAFSLLKYFCGWEPFDDTDRSVLLALIVLASLVFYPLALGISYMDPYRLGFGNMWFGGILFLIAMIACYKRFPLTALCVALSVLAWSMGWYESTNLWNYLFDPFLAVYAIGSVIWKIQKYVRNYVGM
jgi:hypothetical protein